jgi:two-component system alkaline phosphatase synthesis response regulator PhoP
MAERKRVLLVDDDADFVASVKGILERGLAADVEVAYDGVEAAEKVAARPPDLIVLDVMMPRKDGYDLCAELKGDARYRAIPIVLLTAVAEHVRTTNYSHYDGITTEADDYLPKPVDAEDLLRIAGRLLR